MINRRLIRIKTFQALFGSLESAESKQTHIQSSIEKSIHGMKQNLFAVLSFGPELAHFISAEYNPSEFKYTTTSEDTKSFDLFTKNPLINKLAEQEDLLHYVDRPTISWSQEKETLFIIYKELKKSEEYKAFIQSNINENDFISFGKYIYKHLIFKSVEFEQFMEEKNIFWYDEKIPIIKSIEKIFETFDQKNTVVIPALFKNEKEDLKMVDDLLTAYFNNKFDLEESLTNYTPDWDNDRITKIDYTLLLMALTEFKYMPMIPVKVTLNEYIEIAKMYSTPKSSKFINGTLDKILHDWKKQDMIHKKGRGLIG